MKCQRCHKPSTVHITEIHSYDSTEELRLCENCAKSYLYPSNGSESGASGPTLETDPEYPPSTKICEHCGLKFVEFRNSGRLGCPHDYDEFRDELLPLLESIHGVNRHEGKSPQRSQPLSDEYREINQLRRQLAQAVEEEAYETAAFLRDQIRTLEELDIESA